MRTQLRSMLMILVGSFSLYCTQAALDGPPGLPGGGVRDASAQASNACCEPREREVIFDADVPGEPVPGNFGALCASTSTEIDIRRFSRVSVHVKNGVNCDVQGDEPVGVFVKSGRAGLVRVATASEVCGHALVIDAALGQALVIRTSTARQADNTCPAGTYTVVGIP